MKKYKIYAGLGGGFGGATFIRIEEHKDRDSAVISAWEHACEDYEMYDGLHGLRTAEDIMEEEGIDDYDEACEVYREERESWLDYRVEEVKENGI